MYPTNWALFWPHLGQETCSDVWPNVKAVTEGVDMEVSREMGGYMV